MKDMSIDATITGISRTADGKTRLTLDQPDRRRVAGQSVLTVIDPVPSNIAILLGKPVWGGCNSLMCGEVQIGERIGYTRVKLDYNKLIEVACGPVLKGQIDVRDLHQPSE
jgi:hypothetical protein